MSTITPSSPSNPEARESPVRIAEERVPSPRPPPPRSTGGGNVAAYILIVLGVFFLLATIVPVGGGVVLLGIGLAFLVARLTTGRYGMAVPAGILLGLGLFVALNDAGVLPGDNGGWALVFMGLGFFAVYPLGGRLNLFWPVFPGAIMLAMGVAMLDASALAPLAPYASLASYWPIVLVAIGLWILVRDALPSTVRSAARALVVATLILLGVLAIAVTVAASVNPSGVSTVSPFIPAIEPFTPANATTTLTAPIASGDRIRIVNETGGSTRIISGDGQQVRVQVTRRPGFGPPAQVSLVPGTGEVTLDARNTGGWTRPSPGVSFVVEAPASAAVILQSSSGDVSVGDRQGAVQIDNSSGSVTVARVGGPVDVRTSSGDISVADVAGETSLASSSGSIDGSGLRHPRGAQSSSGRIRLSGTFAEDTRIQSSSGSVTVQLSPDSSTRITAQSSSGAISTSGLTLASLQQSRNSLDATLGSGDGTLAITTSSGSIHLEAQP